MLRVEYPRAIYHVMSRGNRGRDIFLDDVDGQDFIKTLAEACKKTGWHVYAYCLMRNHYHVVLEKPGANLVAEITWLQSIYTNRLNHRIKRCGNVFSGRYKAQMVKGSSRGYLRTACDYVHLNPVRTGLLRGGKCLRDYPWSSLMWYAAAPSHRPSWMRVDRLLGEHGFGGDSTHARQAFQRLTENRRLKETDEAALKPMRRGWYVGGEKFRQRLLKQMMGKIGKPHSGALRRNSAEAKGRVIMAEELKQIGWRKNELRRRPKGAHRNWRLRRGCAGKRRFRSNKLPGWCNWARPKAPMFDCTNG